MKNRLYIAVIAAALLMSTAWVLFSPSKKAPKSEASQSTVVMNQIPWVDGKWRTSTPEEQGIDSVELSEMLKTVRLQGTAIHSMLVIRNGYLTMNAFFGAHHEEDGALYPMHSVTKSVVSALTGIAIEEGILKGTEQKVLESFPEESTDQSDPNKAAITIKHLLTMQSGLQWPETEIPYGSNNIVTKLFEAPNQVRFILQQPTVKPPGSGFNYDTGAGHLLSAMIQKSAGKNLEAYAKEKLFGPLGIKGYRWDTDKQGVSVGGTGLYLAPEEMAKIGYLYANNGKMGGKQIVSERWIRESTSMNTSTPLGYKYGYQWWGGPDFYFASGSYGQGILVSPKQNLVAVMTGNINTSFAMNDITNLFTRIQRAIRSDQALPANMQGNQELKEQIRLSGSPQRPVPSLPVVASEVSGKTYDVVSQKNKNAVIKISLSFEPNSNTAIFKTSTENNTREILVGLDNVYRKKGDVSAKGYWSGEEFVLNLHAVSPQSHSPSDAVYTFRFHDTSARMELKGLTGSGFVEIYETLE